MREETITYGRYEITAGRSGIRGGYGARVMRLADRVTVYTCGQFHGTGARARAMALAKRWCDANPTGPTCTTCGNPIRAAFYSVPGKGIFHADCREATS